MRSTPILPWLLFAPLLLVALALPLWLLSGWVWLAWVAQLAGGLALLVVVAAFIANWRAVGRRRRQP